MNFLYCGLPVDVNIGNGKSLSGIEQLCKEHFADGKQVFSNIKLYGIPYTPFTPDNIDEVLEMENVVVFFDEVYTVLHNSHKISPTCKKHGKVGLCFDLIKFFRQIRKLDGTTISTSQLFGDSQYQLRMLMQEIFFCEKYHWVGKSLVKCKMDKNKCPPDHEHVIKKTNYRTGEESYIWHPELYYGVYNTNEIVDERWIITE